MNKSRFQFAVVCAALVFGAASLHAQATRTWVSGVGDDANPCSRTAPCKTFAGAISKTAEGGEIDPLDPGGYGTLTITKAITIDGGTGEGWASVLNAGGVAGFNVNVTGGTFVNTAVVIVRNVSFNGASQSPSGAGTHGINYIRAANLIVENCVFENQGTTGITETLATTGTLNVDNCFFDNTNTGMLVTTSSGFSAAHVDNCRFNALATGINTSVNCAVTVRNCNFAQTTSANGAVRAAPGATINVSNSTFASNTTGANVAGGVIRLSNNDFFNNATGVAGTAESANNNRFRGNTTDGTTTNVIVVK
ncbi:MAG TPA: right-handed parallel beta-helix repeat-containing protein [Chthoniobacterales bacterium]